MKILTTILLAVSLLLGTVAVADDPKPEVSVLSTMDIRRSPTQAPLMHRTNAPSEKDKSVDFTFYTGDLFKYNPNAHGYLMTDGYIDSSTPKASLQGRGITIGHVNNCDGIGFEHFGVNTGFKEPCIDVKFADNSFYDIKTITTKDTVYVYVLGPDDFEAEISKDFSGDYDSYDTVFGVAFDFKSSTYGFFNMVQVLK